MRKKYFYGKNAVITGAASGIGREFARQLAKLGTNLLISDINVEKLEETRKELEKFNIKVFSLKCDVTKQTDVKNLAKLAIEKMKNIHFLFSNAGIAIGGFFEILTKGLWDRIIKINLYGNIYVVRAFILKMLEQGFGHIIITGSIASTLGVGGLSPYNITKFANAGFCEALYGEYHKRGINVSLICPFPLKTNLIESAGLILSPELISDLDPDILRKGIDIGKKHYWEIFTKKQSILKGFAGGFTVERAVKRFLKKIKKKKLYIYDRRYGRIFLFIKGFWPGLYKRLLSFVGKHHTKLIQNSIDLALDYTKKEQQKLNQ
ncbi:MAG: SDR family NAD(P)-dependent oxidoreductase [Promethearchaeota archaeon]